MTYLPTIPITTSPFGFLIRPDELLPGGHVAPRAAQAELLQDDLVEALVGEDDGHLVDRLHVLGGDDRLLGHVAEEGELGLDVGGEEAVGAAEEDARRDADRAQLAHAVLHGLGLELVGGRDVGDEGEVDEDGVLAAHVLAELADRLEEGQALDVAHRAADLHDHHVGVLAPPRGCAALISSVMCGITCTVRPR